MLILRALGALFAVAALVALALDVAAAADLAMLELRALGALWHDTHSDSLQLLQPAVERHLHPLVWERAVFPLLLSPAVAVLGGAALLFLALGALGRLLRGRGAAAG